MQISIQVVLQVFVEYIGQIMHSSRADTTFNTHTQLGSTILDVVVLFEPLDLSMQLTNGNITTFTTFTILLTFRAQI